MCCEAKLHLIVKEFSLENKITYSEYLKFNIKRDFALECEIRIYEYFLV